MKATEFEFRNRWWFIAGIYNFSFFLYAFRDRNSVASVLHWIARRFGNQWASDTVFHWAFAIGAALTILNALLRSWASAYLGGMVVHQPGMQTNRLVADGPYRYLRNPLYLGNILLAIGFAFVASRVGAVVLIIGNVLFLLRLIGREEAGLMATQGDSYRQYVNLVPRLLPAMTPRVPRGNVPARWLQGFVTECMMWGFASASTVFAITLQVRDFYFFLAAGILGSVVVNYTAKRKAAAAS